MPKRVSRYRKAKENRSNAVPVTNSSGVVPIALLGTGTPDGTKFLRDDNTLQVPGGGGGSATTVEKDLGSTPISQGSFTITDASITALSKVLVWQAPGPYTGKGTRADEAELQPIQVLYAEPASGSCLVRWQTQPLITMKRVVDDPGRFEAAGATFDRNDNMRWPDEYTPTRLGKVRGNVKFSYQILS